METTFVQFITLLLSLPWGPMETDILHRYLYSSTVGELKITKEETAYLWNFTQLPLPAASTHQPNSISMSSPVSSLGKNRVDLYSAQNSHVHTKSIINTDTKKIRFFLYNDESTFSKIFGQELRGSDLSTLRSAGIRSEVPTKILIHGFQQTFESSFPQQTKDAYMNSGESYNVICVDWGPLARTTATGPLSSVLYPFVIENVPRVGQKVADFLYYLKSQGIIQDFANVHIIGFSLGAHAAGIAGHLLTKKTGRQVGRITGLDPAGPKYSIQQPFARRLDRSDATFVDVVHTDSIKLGYPGQLGHVDFYPNGGKKQPNCAPHEASGIMKNILYSIQDLVNLLSSNLNSACSHSRAPMYFTKSITSEFTACKCSSWVEFRRKCKGQCSDNVVFGEHARHNARGSYFLDMTI